MAETQRIKKNIAIFDLGSNTFNFLIGELGGLEPKILHQDKRAVKFGLLSRSTDSQVISDTLERAENTLADFTNIARDYQCDRIIARGTASFRDYAKSEEFIGDIQQKLGFTIEQITGLQEADHIFYGIAVKVRKHIPDQVYLIMDIGGGSVEFIIGKNDEMLYKTSLPLGAIRAHETIHPSNPYTPKNQDNFRDWINTNIPELSKAVHEFKPAVLIGSSGSFDTFTDILFYPGSREQEFTPIPLSQFQDLSDQLIPMLIEERKKVPGMTPFRAEYLGYACLLCNHILDQFSIQNIYQTNASLKEGVYLLEFHNYGQNINH